MSQVALDKFGRLLMEEVRDRAIYDWEQILSGSKKSPELQAIYSRFTEEQRQAVRALVPNIVDTSLHFMLSLIDWRDDIQLRIDPARGNEDLPVDTSDEREYVELRRVSDGLPGELCTSDGWIARFSGWKDGVE